jgi:hypothetical protein
MRYALCAMRHASGMRSSLTAAYCLLQGARGARARGRQKQKSVTPVGWVRGQKKTGVRFISPDFFNGVFELPSPRNAQKRD